MEGELLRRFDRQCRKAGYSCRSEALRDLIRHSLAKASTEAGQVEAVGTLTLIFDHERHNLAHRLTHLQHNHHAEITTTVHVHLDQRNCLEVLVLRGRADRIRQIADGLRAVKGVRHGELALATIEEEV